MLPLYQCSLLPDFPTASIAASAESSFPRKGRGNMPKRLAQRNRRAAKATELLAERAQNYAVTGTRRPRSQITAIKTNTNKGTAARFVAAQPTAWNVAPANSEHTATVPNTNKSLMP